MWRREFRNIEFGSFLLDSIDVIRGIVIIIMVCVPIIGVLVCHLLKFTMCRYVFHAPKLVIFTAWLLENFFNNELLLPRGHVVLR